MQPYRPWLIAVIAVLTIVGSAPQALAEAYVDVYGAVGFPGTKPDPVIRAGGAFEDVVGVALETTLYDVELNGFLLGGLRLGYWLPMLRWLGFGVDFGLMRISADEQRISSQSNVAATIKVGDEAFTVQQGFDADLLFPSLDILTGVIAFDLLSLRWPLLKTPDRPQGRLQPYLMAGPALLLVLRNLGNQATLGAELGVKVSTGVAWQFHRRFAVFVEYRFTYFEPTIDTGTVSSGGVTVAAEMDFDIATHYLNFGLSFRFL